MNELTPDVMAQAKPVCLSCLFPFDQKRKDQKFCTPKCRKSSHQKKERAINKINSKNSPSKRRENMEFFDRAFRLAEMLHSMSVDQKLGFINDLVEKARNGDTKIKAVLTNSVLLFPDSKKKYLFFEGQCTIAQAANSYCWASPWRAGVRKVLSGKTPYPNTGEVV